MLIVFPPFRHPPHSTSFAAVASSRLQSARTTSGVCLSVQISCFVSFRRFGQWHPMGYMTTIAHPSSANASICVNFRETDNFSAIDTHKNSCKPIFRLVDFGINPTVASQHFRHIGSRRGGVYISAHALAPLHISGRFARTSAAGTGGVTALPQRATCLLLPYGCPSASWSIT